MMGVRLLLVICAIIPSSTGNLLDTKYLKDHCISRKDGNYSVPDVFKYLECEKEKGILKDCIKGRIFFAKQKSCDVPSKCSLENFCMFRDNGNYRDPWNCTKFIMCVHGETHVMDCPGNLVYNPSTDQCEYPQEMPCQQLSGNPCSGKTDGNYTVPNVFDYLTCKNGKNVTNTCPPNKLFDPTMKHCVFVYTETITTFCKGRENKDYMNPWNCHTFLRCNKGVAMVYACLINGFVYNPELDVCVQPGHYPCKKVGERKPQVDNPCTMRGDGDFSIRDVFAYLHCKNKSGGIMKCKTNEIFDPTEDKCADASKTNLKNFCVRRSTDDYRNPWNCHSFISCVGEKPYPRNCSTSLLVYDPYSSRCEHPDKFPCTQLDKRSATYAVPLIAEREEFALVASPQPQIKDICTTLPDGNYATRDVFEILQCVKHKSMVYKCPPNMIYIPGDDNCTDASGLSLESFCDMRSEGNWQNPWNCNAYITCHGGLTTVRNCSNLITLNYDPVKDACVYPQEAPCEHLESCDGKLNGNYTVPDVFKFLHCKSKMAYLQTCYPGDLFSPLLKLCTPSVQTNLANFCMFRNNGNYRNPWNCTKFLMCVHAETHVMDCPGNLVYNPSTDQCEYLQEMPCQQLPYTVSQCYALRPYPNIYPCRDIFMYCNVTSRTAAHTVACNKGDYYNAKSKRCENLIHFKLDNFCEGRGLEVFRNPMDCHSYYLCEDNNDSSPKKMPCYPSKPVFNCISGACEVNSSTNRCEEMSPYVSSCNASGRVDGRYEDADVFLYCNVINDYGDLVACPYNKLFLPMYNRCINQTFIDDNTFCLNRGNTLLYRYPWDCHYYAQCSGRSFTKIICPKDIYNRTLVFNPRAQRCLKESRLNTCKIMQKTINPCLGVGDTHIALRDVFRVLMCKRNIATHVTCPEGYIYSTKVNKCVSLMTQRDSFCKGRPSSNWRNPWNCHGFIACVAEVAYFMRCPPADPPLVYQPEIDRCVYAEDFECKQQEFSVVNPCTMQADGVYAIPDVFNYLSCKGGQATYHSCAKDYIFSPGEKTCVDISMQSIERFCQNRTEGDWTNPWDCHSLVKCHVSFSYVVQCQLSNLVFDPYTDACVYPEKYTCKQIEQSSTVTETCATLPDGQYAISDVFKYLVCKSGKSSYKSCPDNQIYSAVKHECVDSKTISLNTFCNARPNGDWVDPWNCHKFIKCFSEVTYSFDCQLSNLVFDPYTDACVYPEKYTCKQIEQSSTVTETCATLPDGQYAISDVFKYLVCKSGKSLYKSCPDNQIYSAVKHECVDSKTISLNTFCNARPNGDWVDPWNCHKFIKCFSEVTYSFDCQLSNLVFDPYTDACVYPEKYTCKQIEQSSTVTETCATLPDGQYAISDVFKYLVCKSGKSSYKSCPDNQIYSAVKHECVDSKTISLNTFCNARPNGDWVDPWNCHKFIKCFSEVTYSFDCQLSNLVFDPYTDACVYPEKYACKQIKPQDVAPSLLDRSCKGAKDGVYVIRDVFSYLYCLNELGTIKPCPSGFVFSAKTLKCLNGSKMTQKYFCVNRESGNYRNPWDCHAIGSCLNGVFQSRLCSWDLIYDSYRDLCDYISATLSSSNQDNPCSGKADGNYTVPNVFDYLTCKNGKNTTNTCPPNKLFDPTMKHCVFVHTETITTFCKGRENKDYMNPWNCHTFLRCNKGAAMVYACLINGFVYNPELDVCVQPGDYPCKQVGERKPQIKDICTTLPDGNYATRDVFEILQCSGNKSTVYKCPQHTIYTPGAKNCSDPPQKEHFCDMRSAGNWQNPWDCHSYITCSSGGMTVTNCSNYVVLNYDPVRDACEYPQQAPCQQLEAPPDTPPADPCATLADGDYAIRDVFVILVCSNHKHRYITCPSGTIYLPEHKDCSSAKDLKMKDFCKGRSDGNWRNPWDCYNFITCHAGMAFDRVCSTKTMIVYDPYNDRCEYPTIFPCKNLTLPSLYLPATNLCDGKNDGDYPIRDVFKYLNCRSHVAKFIDCPKDKFYSTEASACVSGKGFDIDKFCIARYWGNWRNPWYCHGYITCISRIVYRRPCSTQTVLNYDPNTDVCDYPSSFPCVEIDADTAQIGDVIEDEGTIEVVTK